MKRMDRAGFFLWHLLKDFFVGGTFFIGESVTSYFYDMLIWILVLY